MAQDVDYKAFVGFGQHQLVQLGKFTGPQFCIEDDYRSLWVGRREPVISFEHIWLWPNGEEITFIAVSARAYPDITERFFCIYITWVIRVEKHNSSNSVAEFTVVKQYPAGPSAALPYNSSLHGH